jgi:hypothetical protein
MSGAVQVRNYGGVSDRRRTPQPDLQGATNNYATDKTGIGPFTRAELADKIRAGDTLTIMGVPISSGQQMGIDRNLNGVTNGDEMPPLLTTTRLESGIVVSWAPGAAGVVLEFRKIFSLTTGRLKPACKP